MLLKIMTLSFSIILGTWFMTDPISKSQKTNREVLMHSIMAKASRHLEKKYGMHQCGFGSSFDKVIKRVSLAFQLRKNLSKNKCRKLLIDCAETLIDAFNANKEIQPYISHPFNSKNIKLSIFLSDENGYNFYHPNYCVICLFESNLDYSTELKNQEFGYYTQEEESYDEALAIVKQQEQLKKN